MMKRKYFSLILFAALLVSFIMGYMVASQSWKCPECSFNSENIIPLVNEQYFNQTLKEIQNAESSIDIVLYEFKWYETNNTAIQLRTALIEKQKENVSIRIILDQSEWYGEETDLSKENKKTAKLLADNGISVKMDSMKITTHDKLLVIDNETVIVGSHNWGSSALTKNNEASVMIKDKKIAEYYENYFEFLWSVY